MSKYNEVSVRPSNATQPSGIIPKKGGLMSGFNRAAGRGLNMAFGTAEVVAGWGTLGIGTLGAIALTCAIPLAGMIALPTAIMLGSVLVSNGMNRIHGNTGNKRGRTSGPQVSNKPGGGSAHSGGGRGSRFVPTQETGAKQQEWYDKGAPAQEQAPDPGPFNPTQPGSGNNPFPMYGGPKLS